MVPRDYDMAAAAVLSDSSEDVKTKFGLIFTSLIFLYYNGEMDKSTILGVMENIDVLAYRNFTNQLFPYNNTFDVLNSKEYIFKQCIFLYGDDNEAICRVCKYPFLTSEYIAEITKKYKRVRRNGFLNLLSYFQMMANRDDSLRYSDLSKYNQGDIAVTFLALTNTRPLMMFHYAKLFAKISEILDFKKTDLQYYFHFYPSLFSKLFLQNLMAVNYITEDDLSIFGMTKDNESWKYKPTYYIIKTFEEKLQLEQQKVSALINDMESKNQIIDIINMREIEANEKVDSLLNRVEVLNRKNILLKTKVNELEANRASLYLDNFVVNKEIVKSNYPVLEALLQRYVNNAKELDILYSVGTCAKILGNASYSWMAKQLPLYDESTIRKHNDPKVKFIEKGLLDVNNIQNIINDFYKDKKPSLITLGGDAASIKPTGESSKNNIYAFELLPLEGNLKPCVIHLETVGSGTSTKEVHEIFEKIISKLKELNIATKFKATDGDVSFDKMHDDWFGEHIAKYKSFEDVINHVITLNEIPVSDFLHLIKCARSHLLNHLIMLVPELLICMNVDLMKECTDLGASLTDLTTSGRMKDSYPLAIFSWDTYMSLLNAGRYDACFYILPFIYMGTAIRQEEINISDRISLLKSAYEIFMIILNTVKQNGNNKLFPPTFTAGALGTLFGSNNFLHRLINTCVAITVAMKLGITNLATQRIGTHDLECFFGCMRLASSYNHTKEEAIRACINSILLMIETTKMNQKIKIRTRDNMGGIILTEDMNLLPSIGIDWLRLHIIIYDLLCEKNVSIKDLSYLKATSNSIALRFKCEKIIHPTLFAGYGPTDRNIRYIKHLSCMPISIPDIKSPFDFFANKQRYLNVLKNNEFKKWTGDILKTMINPKYIDDLSGKPIESGKHSRKQLLINATMREYENLINALTNIIRCSRPTQITNEENTESSAYPPLLPTNADLVKIFKSMRAKQLEQFIQTIKKDDENVVTLSLYELDKYYKEYINKK